MKPSDFFVSQKLVFLSTAYGRKAELVDVVVVSLGRKWVTFCEGKYIGRKHLYKRFDPADMRVDGGNYSSPGRIVLGRKEYEREQERIALLCRIKIACESASALKSIVSNDELKAFAERLKAFAERLEAMV